MPVTVPRASVVIPAHNEEHVIGRCLDRLAQSASSELEVVVVANGCTDRTVRSPAPTATGSPTSWWSTRSGRQGLGAQPGRQRSRRRSPVCTSTLTSSSSPRPSSPSSPDSTVPRPRRCTPGHVRHLAVQSLGQGLLHRLPVAALRHGRPGGPGLYAVTEAGRRRFGGSRPDRRRPVRPAALRPQRARDHARVVRGPHASHGARPGPGPQSRRSRNAELAQAGASPEVSSR